MAELEKGARIGAWVVERLLGRGSFGITYLARHSDPKLSRLLVAIKEFYPSDLVSRREDGTIAVSRKAKAQFEAERSQFLEEAQAVASISHPNIVTVQDFILANGTSYIVMQLARGPSLLDRVGTRRKPGIAGIYDVEALRPMLAQLLDALNTIHNASPPLLHRDIKPQNIIIDEQSGRPILLDFGAARQFSAGLSHKMTAILTKGFAPYEQYTLTDEEFEEEYDDLASGGLVSMPRQGPWGDIYALGAVCHYALTGAPPPDSLRRKLGAASYTPLGQRVEGPAEFLHLIDRALAIEPADRFQTAGDWMRAIDRDDMRHPRQAGVITGNGEGDDQGDGNVAKPVASSGMMVLMAGLGLAMLIGIIFLISTSGPSDQQALDSYNQITDSQTMENAEAGMATRRAM